MINWKYKDKYYYFDHGRALALSGIAIILPLLYVWIEGYIAEIFYNKISIITFLAIMVFFIFYILKTSIDTYEPYYYDENGKLIEGNEAVELRKKRPGKLKSK